MTFQSSVASRRSVPQLPPIHTGLNDSLLGPPRQPPSNPSFLQPSLSERSVYPIPTPVPSPANFGIEHPKTPPEPEPKPKPKEDDEIQVPAQPLRTVKSLRSKRSLFKLFSGRNTENLGVRTADDNVEAIYDDHKNTLSPEKSSTRSRSKSQERSSLSRRSQRIPRPKTSEGSNKWRQSPPPDLPTKKKDEVTFTTNSNSIRNQSTKAQVGKDKALRKHRSGDLTYHVSTKRSQTSLRDGDSFRKMWKPPPLFQAYPQAIKYSSSNDNAQASSEGTSAETYQDGSALPQHSSSDRPKSRWRSSNAASTDHLEAKASRLPDHHHIYVLVTSGYLLQYASDGPSDRFPEKMLKLSANSAAFASDLIPGKHWVLQVMSEMQDDASQPLMETKSFLHRLRHSSSNLTVSTLLMVFDGPQDMDQWMTTIRCEIDILAGRMTRKSGASQDPESNSIEEFSPIERYKSISRTSLQPLPPLAGPSSPIHQYAPRSPTKCAVPPSPSTSNSEWMSNSTGPGTSVSEWSSARSSQQTNAAKANLIKSSSLESSGGFCPIDVGSDPSGTFALPSHESGNPSHLLASQDLGHYSTIPRRLSSLNHLQEHDSNTSHGGCETLRILEHADDATPEFTKDDSEFYKDFIDLVADCDGFSIEGDIPLMSPSAVETSFPQPPRSNRRLSKMPPNSSHPSFPSSSGCSPMESISESTPYFSRRLPDSIPIEDVESEPEPYRGSTFGTTNVSSGSQSRSSRSAARVSMTPQQIRATAAAQITRDQSSSLPPSRRTSSLFNPNSDDVVSTLNALNGDTPLVDPVSTAASEPPSRRTSVMRSSKAPLPFRASMQFQQTPVSSAMSEASATSSPSAPPAKLLRRPNSIQVRNDPAPFLTTVRSAPSSRAPSMIAEPVSKRSSTSVPIVRPPMRASSTRRQSSLMVQNPTRAPPNIPLPTPPPNVPLPPTPQNKAS